MYVTAQESRALSRLFGLLAEDLGEREVRERIGHHLLELLSADYYASFVWDTPSRSFGRGVWLEHEPGQSRQLRRLLSDTTTRLR